MTSRIKNRETLFEAARFRIEKVSYKLADSREVSREIIQHPGAVVILPLLDDGRICLIKNYRAAVDRELIELPAGTLEPGEPPIDTARRELAEETGFRAGTILPLFQMLMSPGILNERMHVFLAKNLEPGQQDHQGGEEISNWIVSPEQVRELLRSNAILDAKTVSALLYWFQFSE